MKTKYPPNDIHHYHHISYRKNPMKWIILGIVMLSPICVLVEFFNKTSHGRITKGISSFFSSCFSSYWHGLNKVAVFCGWSKGFGFFWQEYPLAAVAIFLGIPILVGILIVLILKRDFLMRQVILLLYLWHYGLSTLIYRHIPWTTLLIIVGSIFSVICFKQFILALVTKYLTFIKPVIDDIQPHIKVRE